MLAPASWLISAVCSVAEEAQVRTASETDNACGQEEAPCHRTKRFGEAAASRSKLSMQTEVLTHATAE